MPTYLTWDFMKTTHMIQSRSDNRAPIAPTKVQNDRSEAKAARLPTKRYLRKDRPHVSFV